MMCAHTTALSSKRNKTATKSPAYFFYNFTPPQQYRGRGGTENRGLMRHVLSDNTLSGFCGYGFGS